MCMGSSLNKVLLFLDSSSRNTRQYLENMTYSACMLFINRFQREDKQGTVNKRR